MLKRKAIKKILLTSLTIIIFLLIYIMPNKTKEDIKVNQVVEYDSLEDGYIYLLNNNDFLVKTKTLLEKDNDYVNKIIDILDSLINIDKIPVGLKSLIPKNTKVNEVKVEEKMAYINFSKELINVDEKYRELLIESICYSIFEIKEITGVSIYVDNESISKYFIDIPKIISREYGINKKYNINNPKNIQKVVTYYIDTINDENYYVPVTNYINSDKDKIKIIVENLSSNYIYEANLKSFLSNKTELTSYDIDEEVMTLNFNKDIFISNGVIKEEVIYTLAYSVFDNYDVNKVIFNVDNNEIKVVEK